MKPIPFYKYESLGNDFIVIDLRGLSAAEATRIHGHVRGRVVSLCARRTGVGSDGVLVVEDNLGSGPWKNFYKARMTVHNADGSISSACGNGVRCVVLHMATCPGVESELRVGSSPVGVGGAAHAAPGEAPRVPFQVATGGGVVDGFLINGQVETTLRGISFAAERVPVCVAGIDQARCSQGSGGGSGGRWSPGDPLGLWPDEPCLSPVFPRRNDSGRTDGGGAISGDSAPLDGLQPEEGGGEGGWRLDRGGIRVGCVSVGNPHAVVLGALPEGVLEYGARLSSHPAFPQGVNVGFARIVSKTPARIALQVHERGVGPTLACGTGAAAAALVACRWGRLEPQEWIEVEQPGGTLMLRVAPDWQAVQQRAPARLVFKGSLS